MQRRMKSTSASPSNPKPFLPCSMMTQRPTGRSLSEFGMNAISSLIGVPVTLSRGSVLIAGETSNLHGRWPACPSPAVELHDADQGGPARLGQLGVTGLHEQYLHE